MSGFTEVQYAQACLLKARADYLVSYYGVMRFRGPLTIPDEWTVWLLMDKAGVPRDLIAHYCCVDRPFLNTRLRLATALMIFSPFAARVGLLMDHMPRFSASAQGSHPVTVEGACVAQAE